MDIEFEYNGKKYYYKAEDYKVYDLQDEDGNDINDDDIYAAAEQDLTNQFANAADDRRDDERENGPWPDTVRFP